jgi:hypothetical protein
MAVERMRILTDQGQRVVTVVVRSQAASLVGGHWNAIKTFRDTGDASLLARYRGVSIGIRTPSGFRPTATFATDLDMIRRWARQGELDLDDPYAEVEGYR